MRALGGGGRMHGIACRVECGKQPIALRVHLDAPALGERPTQ